MRKDESIELAVENLSGGDTVSDLRKKYHPAIVEKYLGMAYADIIQDQFVGAGTDFTVFDNFSKQFSGIVVKYDVNLDMRYVDLPVPIIPLTPKQAAIRAISKLKGQQQAFAPIQATSVPMWSELEAMRVDSTIAYKLDGQRLYFPFNVPELDSELLISLICPFESLADEDEVFVPGGKNEMLFDRMYNFMNRRGNSGDQIDDSNSTQPNK